MMPLGFAIAASTRVGNLIGAGNYQTAKQSTYTLFILIFGVYLINSNVTYFFRYLIARIYTDDVDVIEKFATVIPFVSYVFLFVDPFQGSLGGVLRGLGKQGIAAGINLIAFYIFGLPFAFVSILVLHWGLFGAWLGLFIGEGVIMIGYITLILRTDWKAVSEQARSIATQGQTISSTNLLSLREQEEDEKIESLEMEETASVSPNQVQEDV